MRLDRQDLLAPEWQCRRGDGIPSTERSTGTGERHIDTDSSQHKRILGLDWLVGAPRGTRRDRPAARLDDVRERLRPLPAL
jgi:hypothetical protein